MGILVCMDETSKQQVRECRVPQRPARHTTEYERNGVSSLFMALSRGPGLGAFVVLVMDNLNTHKVEASASEARRIAERYTTLPNTGVG